MNPLAGQHHVRGPSFFKRFLGQHRSAILVVAGLIRLLQPSLSYAQRLSIEDVGSQVGLSGRSLPETLRVAIQWALGVLGVAAVALIVYGGFVWMTAAGSEETIAKAKKIIGAAVIGLVIVMLAWAIVVFVVGTASDVIK